MKNKPTKGVLPNKKPAKEPEDFLRKLHAFDENLVIVKHIPHSTLKTPEGFVKTTGMSRMEFERYNLKMSDVGVDRLFEDLPGIEIRAEYSRLFCDVERFKDDDKEPMAKLGQGYRYTKTYDGKMIAHSFLNGTDFSEEASAAYDRHHANLNHVVASLFKEGKHVLLLDIHSYSDEMASSLGKKAPFPDLCLGVEEGYCPEALLHLFLEEIKKRGLSVQMNYPYVGSILPSEVLEGKCEGVIYTLMLEINKRVYL